MKIIYRILIFLILINIFIPMVASLGFFSNTIEGDTNYYNLNDENNLPSSDTVFERTSGYGFSSLTNIGFETLSVLGLSTLVGLALMKLTQSILPLIVSLFFATFFNIYLRSSAFISQIKLNPYLILAFGVIVLIIFIITIIEYFAQGDISDG